MKRSIYILLLFVFSNGWAIKPDTTGIEKLLLKAKELEEKGDFAKALDVSKQIISESNKRKFTAGIADGYFLQAICLSRTNEIDLAKKSYLTAWAYYKVKHDSISASLAYDGLTNMYQIEGDSYYQHLLQELNGERLQYLDPYSLFFFSLYLGALLFCLIYNIFLYRFTKDKSYREMSKCIAAFLLFIYNTNYDFATQFNRALLDFSILSYIKNYSIIFGTYFFATFLEELLISSSDVLKKFYRFLSAYKKIVKIWLIVSTVCIIIATFKFHSDAYNYFRSHLIWFAFNDLLGLAMTILMFSMLFFHASKNKVPINYLIYGFVLNLICLIFSAWQAVTANKYTNIPNPAALGSVLFLIFMTVAITDKINSYRKEKEEAQSNALKHLEGLVAERTKDIQHQKELIEEKQIQILDSINYAKRLQQAILVPEQDLRKHFKEIFVLYKPKDIVSGDFYWFSESDNNKILAVADCTGHGVPGGFMCMLANECLQDVALRKDIETTASALRSLDIKITETLNKSDRSFRDGMDIVLCAFSKDSGTLQFSGANRPLIQVTDGKLIEHKPDKQTIGGNIDRTEKNYHTTLINCKPGDTFYLFTDGYADQFGGPKGKKFKHKTLREILFGISNLSLKEQSTIINRKFEEWKGSLEQVDDVCIIGIRI